MHAADIEVILDVVYNHTAEGNHLGPTLSFRGLDNPSYYRLNPNDPRYYADTTGTGNALNVSNPQTLQLLMDSLRYWVLEMHVDGFRFDLAASLARQFHEVDRLSAFFDLIHQDPVISQIKLIAEPWDLGSGGYQVGNFPVLWSEWNGRYRDSIRDYWRQENTSIGELAYRLTGSSDLYEATGRRPWASINFVTAHDGFTMADLVSYDHKHNEANGEGNKDGTDDNRSWNCGVEGPTDNPDVLALRARQTRNFLATLALSLGVPMFLGGDELGRSQQGNNNAYCQDNEVSWYDWENVDADLLIWTQVCPRPAPQTPRFPAAPLFPGPTAATARFGPEPGRHRLVPPGWPPDDRRRLGSGVRQVPGGINERRFAERSGPPWPAGGRLLVLPGLQRLGRATSVPPSWPEVGRPLAGRGRHRGQQAGRTLEPGPGGEDCAVAGPSLRHAGVRVTKLSHFATQSACSASLRRKSGGPSLTILERLLSVASFGYSSC